MSDPRALHPVYVSDPVREVERLHGDLLTDAVRQLPIREQLDRQAHRILEGHRSGDRAVVPQITCWHPQRVCHSADDILGGEFTLDDARQTIAREYGFADWSDVEARGSSPPDPDFEFAVDTLLRGDAETLRSLLTGDPSLIHRRSSFGGGGTGESRSRDGTRPHPPHLVPLRPRHAPHGRGRENRARNPGVIDLQRYGNRPSSKLSPS